MEAVQLTSREKSIQILRQIYSGEPNLEQFCIEANRLFFADFGASLNYEEEVLLTFALVKQDWVRDVACKRKAPFLADCLRHDQARDPFLRMDDWKPGQPTTVWLVHFAVLDREKISGPIPADLMMEFANMLAPWNVDEIIVEVSDPAWFRAIEHHGFSRFDEYGPNPVMVGSRRLEPRLYRLRRIEMASSPNMLVRRLFREPPPVAILGLSETTRKYLGQVRKQGDYKQMAADVGISERSMKRHVRDARDAWELHFDAASDTKETIDYLIRNPVEVLPYGPLSSLREWNYSS